MTLQHNSKAQPVSIKNEPDARSLGSVNGAIDFNEVSFSYLQGKPILKQVSFSIKAGEFVAVAGGSGSANSTLLKLLPRFYDVDSGSITFDGTPIKMKSMETA